MAGWEERFDDYVGRLGDVLGHADRRAPLRAYATGLLLPGERKSVEPMAARVEPARVGAAHQSLHHFVAAARTISRSSRCRITQAASLS
jgi:SRSO17 transposase